MYRKVLLTGVTAAAIIGAGGTALALTGSSGATAGTPAAAPSSSSAPAAGHAKGHAKGKAKLLRRLSHGEIVTRGKGGFVTHALIRGTVTAVAPTSITVQAADKTSETFAITKDTNVRVRANGKGSASTIGKVAKGDRVLVTGTGTTHRTAQHVVDVHK